nr:MAG TPA: hypothetical protein [Caudoviricetes sp.]
MDEENRAEIVRLFDDGEIYKDEGNIYTEKEMAIEVIRDTMMKNGSELVRTGIFRASRKLIAAWVDTRVRERALFDSYDQWRRDRERRIEKRRVIQRDMGDMLDIPEDPEEWHIRVQQLENEWFGFVAIQDGV